MSAVAKQYAFRDLETVTKALKLVPGRTACIQAGACLGVFPQYLAGYFNAVYAFEPDPFLFRKSIAHAPELNIHWYQAALGKDRELVHTLCSRRDGSTRPVHEGLTYIAGSGSIPTMRIDDLGLPVCDLICLDVEGYELRALQGARETINRCRPVLIVEVNKQIRYSGITEEDLRTHLRMAGYQMCFRNYSDEVYVPCATMR